MLGVYEFQISEGDVGLVGCGGRGTVRSECDGLEWNVCVRVADSRAVVPIATGVGLNGWCDLRVRVVRADRNITLRWRVCSGEGAGGEGVGGGRQETTPGAAFGPGSGPD